MSKVLELRRVRRQQTRQVVKQDDDRLMHSINAVKTVTLYTLRNQGWGKKRLQKFSDEWNECLLDVSHGQYSLSDIADTIYDETGLKLSDLRV